MNNYLFEQNKENLSSLLAENASIGIIIGEPHSIDKVGGALALYLAFTDAGKNVSIVSKKDPIVEVANLVGVDRIKKEFEGRMDMLTVTFPCHGRQIQKVSYNIEGDYLHLNVFGGEDGLTFSEQDVKFTKKGSTPTLIFTVGVPYYQDIESFVGAGGSRIVNLDFATTNEMYGDIILVDPSFVTISEIVAKLIEVLALPTGVDTAQNIMDGLMNATHNFTMPTMGAFTFEGVSFAMKNGAQRKQQAAPAMSPLPPPPQQPQRQDSFVGLTMPQQPFPTFPLVSRPPQQNFGQPKMPPPPIPRPQRSQTNHSFPPPFPPYTPPAFDDFDRQNTNRNVGNDASIPEDWFAPKVYRGSKDNSNNK